MLIHEIVATVAHEINGAAIPNCSLNRRVAIGIKQGGIDASDAWVILDFSSGQAALSEVRHCGPLPDADSALGVDIVVVATGPTWVEIGRGGLASAVLAADTHTIAITGKLAYFIRNVRSSVDLIVLFGDTFARHSAI